MAVHPTEQGVRAAEAVLTTREERVAGLLVCRLCDRDACADGTTTHCPVGAADREARANGPRT